MKDKEKQIEEMTKNIYENVYLQGHFPKGTSKAIARFIIEQGYRKLPEDSVVLSREKYELLVECSSYEGVMKTLKNEYDKGGKKTAKKDFNSIIQALEERKERVKSFYGIKESVGVDIAIRTVKELAKQFGVEITTDDNCKYYDKANMRCNAAKCTPECYCNGHKSECTEYPETRKQKEVSNGNRRLRKSNKSENL